MIERDLKTVNGNRIRVQDGVTLPEEWYVTSDNKLDLRLFKSVLCYAEAVARFCLGRSQVAQSDFLSGSVNVYYALFDIGIAGLDLVSQHHFAIYKEFAFPRGENLKHIKNARITHLHHNEVIKKLHELRPSYPYLADIGDNLNRWKEIRELFSYGPWIKITAIDASTTEKPIAQFVSEPAFFEKELMQAAEEKPEPFMSLKEDLEILVPTVGEVIDGYATFVARFLGEGKPYSWYTAAGHIAEAAGQAPFFFCPYMPESISKEFLSKLVGFVANLGERFLPVAESMSSEFNSSTYLKELARGSKVRARVKLERLVRSESRCMFCGESLTPDAKTCPKCGARKWN